MYVQFNNLDNVLLKNIYLKKGKLHYNSNNNNNNNNNNNVMFYCDQPLIILVGLVDYLFQPAMYSAE